MLGDRLDSLLMLVRSLGPVTRHARRARLIRAYHRCLSGGGEEATYFEKKKPSHELSVPVFYHSTEIPDSLFCGRQLRVLTPTFVYRSSRLHRPNDYQSEA